MEKKKRVVVKPGYIYQIKINDREKCYLQSLGRDIELLNSDYIRVFKTRYPIEASPEMSEIVSDEVLFYGHAFVSFLVKEGSIEKVGKSDEFGLDDLLKVGFFGPIKEMVVENGRQIIYRYVHRYNGELYLTTFEPAEGISKYVECSMTYTSNSIVYRINNGRTQFDRYANDIETYELGCKSRLASERYWANQKDGAK